MHPLTSSDGQCRLSFFPPTLDNVQNLSLIFLPSSSPSVSSRRSTLDKIVAHFSSFSPANLDATSCSLIRAPSSSDTLEFIYMIVRHSFSTLLDDLDEDLHGADEDGREGLDLLGGAGERLPVHLVRQVVCPLRHLSSHL